MADQTWNSAWDEEMRKRIQAAIEANWDSAMEVGCMEHGGFEWLAEAAFRAYRLLPSDPKDVSDSLDRRYHAALDAPSEVPHD